MTRPAQGTDAPHTSAAARGRCVVWCAPGQPVPTALAGALARQGLALTERAGPHETLAACLRLAREPGPCVLVLTSPDDTAAAVAGVLARFAPAVRIWRYDPALQPPLRGFDPAPTGTRTSAERNAQTSTQTSTQTSAARPAAPARAADTPAPAAPPPGSPLLRLVHGSNGSPAPGSSSARDILSADELSMLMGDSAIDPPPEKRR